MFVGLNGMSSSIWEHFPTGQSSPGTPPPLLSTGSMYTEASRLKQEVEEAHRVLKHWDHSWRQMAQVRLHRCLRVCLCERNGELCTYRTIFHILSSILCFFFCTNASQGFFCQKHLWSSFP